MFVTSDIFDLKQIARHPEVDFDWQENLLCGVAAHGSQWPGYVSAPKFLFEAAKRCDLLDAMRSARCRGNREEQWRMLPPRAFGRLEEIEISDPDNLSAFVLTGLQQATGIRNFSMRLGGGASISPNTGNPAAPPKQVDADFVFLPTQQSVETACDMLSLAADILNAEYGYYFVRDDLCTPHSYPCGSAPLLDSSLLVEEDAKEICDWGNFKNEGLWSSKPALLRDLYEVNLLSQMHTSTPVEGLGYLTEWIKAQPGRGRLQDIGRGRFLWILTDSEMFHTRPLLNEAGMLFSCRDRVYRDYPVGGEPR
jgi:hypothetical protein